MARRGAVNQSKHPDHAGAAAARRWWRAPVHAHIVSLLICLIRCYQGVLRPLLAGSCKFCPTCSEYATEALLAHGLWRGTLLAARRLLRCHPFGLGGYDPVPPSDTPHGA